MQTIDQIARAILQREGGYVNDPDDPGGATKFGVTLGTLKSLGIDINKDGQTDRADVRALSEDQALAIFKTHYFHKPKIANLPEVLQASVFDMYVNSGSNAVKILQKLLITFGVNITVDGEIGPKTIRAAQEVYKAAPDHIADSYGIARRNYYYRLADRRAASRKYARRRDGGKGGWILRAEEFMSPRFHFSSQEHRDRTASWA